MLERIVCVGKWAGKVLYWPFMQVKTNSGDTPVVLMKIEVDSVTKQEEVHNIVVKAGPKSHLLYVTVLGGHRYLV